MAERELRSGFEATKDSWCDVVTAYDAFQVTPSATHAEVCRGLGGAIQTLGMRAQVYYGQLKDDGERAAVDLLYYYWKETPPSPQDDVETRCHYAERWFARFRDDHGDLFALHAAALCWLWTAFRLEQSGGAVWSNNQIERGWNNAVVCWQGLLDCDAFAALWERSRALDERMAANWWTTARSRLLSRIQELITQARGAGCSSPLGPPALTTSGGVGKGSPTFHIGPAQLSSITAEVEARYARLDRVERTLQAQVEYASILRDVHRFCDSRQVTIPRSSWGPEMMRLLDASRRGSADEGRRAANDSPILASIEVIYQKIAALPEDQAASGPSTHRYSNANANADTTDVASDAEGVDALLRDSCRRLQERLAELGASAASAGVVAQLSWSEALDRCVDLWCLSGERSHEFLLVRKEGDRGTVRTFAPHDFLSLALLAQADVRRLEKFSGEKAEEAADALRLAREALHAVRRADALPPGDSFAERHLKNGLAALRETVGRRLATILTRRAARFAQEPLRQPRHRLLEEFFATLAEAEQLLSENCLSTVQDVRRTTAELRYARAAVLWEASPMTSVPLPFDIVRTVLDDLAYGVRCCPDDSRYQEAFHSVAKFVPGSVMAWKANCWDAWRRKAHREPPSADLVSQAQLALDMLSRLADASAGVVKAVAIVMAKLFEGERGDWPVTRRGELAHDNVVTRLRGDVYGDDLGEVLVDAANRLTKDELSDATRQAIQALSENLTRMTDRPDSSESDRLSCLRRLRATYFESVRAADAAERVKLANCPRRHLDQAYLKVEFCLDKLAGLLDDDPRLLLDMKQTLDDARRKDKGDAANREYIRRARELLQELSAPVPKLLAAYGDANFLASKDPSACRFIQRLDSLVSRICVPRESVQTGISAEVLDELNWICTDLAAARRSAALGELTQGPI